MFIKHITAFLLISYVEFPWQHNRECSTVSNNIDVDSALSLYVFAK